MYIKTYIINNMRWWARIALPALLFGSLPVGATEPTTIRGLVVSIVAQDGFFTDLFARYVKREGVLDLQLTVSHVRDMADYLNSAQFDFVIAHDHARPAHKMQRQGLIYDGRIVFANPMAIIGPVSDPAKISTARDFDAALNKVLDSGHCWVVNSQSGKAELQRAAMQKFDSACVINESAANGAKAVMLTLEHQAYTVWGLHPYSRLELKNTRAWVYDDRAVRRPLRAWLVIDSPRVEQAKSMIDWLLAAPVQKSLREFRLNNDPVNQAWWPAASVVD